MEVSACSIKAHHDGKQKREKLSGFGKVAFSEKTNEKSDTGAFIRQQNRFDTPFGNKEGDLPVEAGRYRLLWTPICPWATRQVIVLKLLGIDESVIGIGTANPIRTQKGWEFSLDPQGVDPVLQIRYLPEIYAETDPAYQGRATVPTIVDVRTHKVVNNDYHKLSNYWETVWRPYWKENAPDLYPQNLRTGIDALNEILFDEINNGVYKAGFAETQSEYEKNYQLVFNRLDWLDEHLSDKRFLFGDRLTDSDIRLYVTLARFDTAYYFEFRLNRKRIRDYDNLWNYAKELYSIPAFKEATDFDAIRKGYFLGDAGTNPYQILPEGPDESVWEEPNNRSEKFGQIKYHY